MAYQSYVDESRIRLATYRAEHEARQAARAAEEPHSLSPQISSLAESIGRQLDKWAKALDDLEACPGPPY